MKNRRSNIICTLLILLSFISTSAQTNNLDFTLTSSLTTVSGVDVPISSTITKTGSTITWLQQADNGNSSTAIYNITNTTGTWDEVNSTGNITYSLDDEGYNYSILLTKTGTSIVAEITYQISATNQNTYTFSIDTITYQ